MGGGEGSPAGEHSQCINGEAVSQTSWAAAQLVAAEQQTAVVHPEADEAQSGGGPPKLRVALQAEVPVQVAGCPNVLALEEAQHADANGGVQQQQGPEEELQHTVTEHSRGQTNKLPAAPRLSADKWKK